MRSRGTLRARRGGIALRGALLAGLLAVPAAADHPKDFRTALEGLKSHHLDVVDGVFLKDASQPGADRLLDLYELGAFYQLAGEPRKSIQFFTAADDVAHDYEGRAVVSLEAAGRSAGAVLVNDSVLKYEGEAYDKVMSRTLDALNYLLVGDLEGAEVELRKAEEYQKLERDRHQREAQPAKPAEGAESATLGNPAVQATYGRMFDYVRNVPNAFQNAFTYYLASQVHRLRGEAGLNDAMVEIRQAFALAPEAPAVRAAYLELARAQGGSAWDEARRLLGASDPGPAAPGSVVVVFEAGLVPRMGEVFISLSALDRSYNLAFPIYKNLGTAEEPLTLRSPAGFWTTSPILDTRRLAVKSLQERLPGILARSLLGAIAKGQAQQKTESRFGSIGGLFSKVTSAALTVADRRSWLSLPAEVQVAGLDLAPGPAKLELHAPDLAETVALDVAPGSLSFLLVRAFPGFQRVDARTFQMENAMTSVRTGP